MKISTIKNVHILLLGLALTLFLNFGAVFASDGNRCLNEDLDMTNNLCEQNARHLALENNLSFVDKIFLKVLKRNAKRMPNIFFEIFNSSAETSVKFLSNKSNIFQDLSIISKMPKWPFIKALFN